MNTISLLIISVCALIQATSFEYISVMGVKPDLLIILVIFFALSFSSHQAKRLAIVIGLLKDVTSASLLGSYTLSFLILAMIISYHQNKFFRERISTQMMIAFISYFFVGVVIFLLNSFSSKSFPAHYSFLSLIVRGSAYTAVISPVVFFILSKILRIRLTTVL
ncbi:rod shape-determining protein MreD [Candidatus Omnitrophota bacterium]